MDQIVKFVADMQARINTADRGATAVEYGLMVAAIAALIIGTVFLLGGKIDALFQGITNKL